MAPPLLTPPILLIARHTLREGLRARSVQAYLAVLVVLGLGAWFAGEMALTESARVRAGFFAATARVAAVFMLCLHVVNALQREWADGEAALILALAIGRPAWLAGRLLGFVLLAALFALLAGAGALAFAPWPPALAWSASLVSELALMAGFATFAALGLRSLPAAMALVAGFYLLGRNLAAILLIAGTPWHDANPWLRYVVDGLALPLPDLSLTSANLLTETAPAWPTTAPIQAVIYLLLCYALAGFDLARRET
jgi:hypothetical protein